MLTYDDAPTIKFAIERRLDKEPGIKYSVIKIAPHLREMPPFIAVGVLVELGFIITKHVFHLPAHFEHRHLLNEIDEIAESIKTARAEFFRNGMVINEPERQVPGTGYRGRWVQYG